MKKIFLLITVTVCIITTSFAQGEFRMGAKAGPNLGNRIGFHLGALIEVPISDKISLQPEILYSSQGTKIESGFFGAQVETDIKLDYLNFPILGKYHILKGLSAELGPVIGVLVKAESKVDGRSRDSKEYYENIDIGIGIGASYLTSIGLFGSLRFNKGITNTNTTSEESLYYNSKNQNNISQISVGYSF
ncbi:porin family protein [Ulvibacter antarcticus]|uniref:Outer membrane protein with beta-barrel domain n=1 Tax=Ulvibacter antarcticus TaxID=442714 RepID=A0A3L9ZC23_9FLAO|nr:porin family protein [Ulvibacter antarcticus]RMA64162.1 outer membrane protein with beta-barrel domain [Ulvibacter antarcticus]